MIGVVNNHLTLAAHSYPRVHTHPPPRKQASVWERSKQLASTYVVPDISVFLIGKLGELEVSPLLPPPLSSRSSGGGVFYFGTRI